LQWDGQRSLPLVAPAGMIKLGDYDGGRVQDFLSAHSAQQTATIIPQKN
jgi:hypothetical protein